MCSTSRRSVGVVIGGEHFTIREGSDGEFGGEHAEIPLRG
jgi:hypothetical protein